MTRLSVDAALGLLPTEREGGRSPSWEVLPGLHYKLSDNWWITGGLIVPVGKTLSEAPQLWRVTCSLQF